MNNKVVGIAIDVETTGLYVGTHEAIEVGAVMYNRDLEPLYTFQSFIKPEKEYSITREAMLVNKISMDTLDRSPSKYSVRAALIDWVASYGEVTEDRKSKLEFMAHRASFDKGFIEDLVSKQWFNEIFSVELCTKSDAILLMKAGKLLSEKSSLSDLKKALDITEEGEAHTAMHDAKACLSVYKKLLELVKR